MADKPKRRGAGILAYALDQEGNVFFLLQQTLSGRKQGQLMDLGGSVLDHETPELGAKREFLEEGGKWLLDEAALERFFVASQTWRGVRIERKKRGWTLFVVRVPLFDLSVANSAPTPEGGKRREYFWVGAKELEEAADCDKEPQEAIRGRVPRVLWQRLRKKRKQLKRAVRLVLAREAALELISSKI